MGALSGESTLHTPTSDCTVPITRLTAKDPLTAYLPPPLFRFDNFLCLYKASDGRLRRLDVVGCP